MEPAGKLGEPARSITLLLVFTGLRRLVSCSLFEMETVYDRHFDRPKAKRGKCTIPIGAETAAVLAALRPSFVDPTRLVLPKAMVGH